MDMKSGKVVHINYFRSPRKAEECFHRCMKNVINNPHNYEKRKENREMYYISHSLLVIIFLNVLFYFVKFMGILPY